MSENASSCCKSRRPSPTDTVPGRRCSWTAREKPSMGSFDRRSPGHSGPAGGSWNMRHPSEGDTVAPLLSFGNVSKRYPDGSREIVVLDSVSFEIETGVFVGIYGGRRSGKSTLLRLAAGVEEPSAGIVRFKGRDVFGMSVLERERLLRRG